MTLFNADFVQVQDASYVFDLDLSLKSSRIDGLGLESGGQLFRSLIAFIGRVALENPQAEFKVVIQNIRKGRKPKTGMRPQHLASVDVVRLILEHCKRNVTFFDDFCEDSEQLTIAFGPSSDFEMRSMPLGIFNVGKINPKTKQPGEEAATLVLQTWLMLTWDIPCFSKAVFGGGLDMGLSPSVEFLKNELAPVLGLSVDVERCVRKTGTITVEKASGMEVGPIASKYLLDQVLAFVAMRGMNTTITYSCELSAHARSQIYLWEGLTGYKFDLIYTDI